MDTLLLGRNGGTAPVESEVAARLLMSPRRRDSTFLNMAETQTSSTADETERYYDESDEFEATDSIHTELTEVPEMADIEFDHETTHEGVALSFLIERAMLDPAATVTPTDTSQ